MSAGKILLLLFAFLCAFCSAKHSGLKFKPNAALNSTAKHLSAKRTQQSADSISWTRYCACLNVAAAEGISQVVKNCFRDFFQTQPVKRIRNRNKHRGIECFESRNDGDAECQVLRKYLLSKMFRKDIKHISNEGMRVLLYALWRGHPDIYEVCQQGVNALYIASLIVDLSDVSFSELKRGNSQVNQLASGIGDEPLGRELTNQVYHVCYRATAETSSGSDSYKISKTNFCDLDFMKRMVRKMKMFTTEAQISGKWTDAKLTNLFNGLRLNFVTLAEYKPDRYGDGPLKVSISDNEKVNGYKNNVNNIIQMVDGRDFDQLQMLTKFLPNDILVCSGSAVQTTEACYFKKILDQLILHFKVSNVPIHGRSRKVLSTSTDYKQLLEYRQMTEILTVVHSTQFLTINLAEEITDSNNQRFVELRQYFVDLQSFNENKAQADVDFIDNWIGKYTTSVATLARQNADSLEYLLKALDAGVVAEVAEKAAAMALAIAEACNPLKTLFGGSSLGDIYEATAAWTKAMGNLGIRDDLKGEIENVIDKTTDMGKRFGNNGKVIKEVFDLVKSATPVDDQEFERQKRDFIDMYSAYSPEVQRPELEELTSTWTGMVETACNVILELETATGTLVSVADVKRAGTCWRLPVSINKMMATYMEIYDFQFDLMETLGSGMRAKIAKREATNIAGNFVSFPERETDNTRKWRSIYTLSYLTYHIQTWNLIELHCDKLEFREGGIRPDKCQGERTNLPLLMARPERNCQSFTGDDVRIPVKPSGDADRAFLNLTNLYKGESVPFRISNSDWLVQHGWIMQSQQNKAMYIRSFELFLPTVSEESTQYLSISQSLGENVLQPCESCTQYILPTEEKSSRFEEGHEASCDDAEKRKNKYTICNSNPLPKYCPKTELVDQPPGTLNPSIYSLWKFKIDGYQATAIPEPGNDDMYIKAKIYYCLMTTGSQGAKAASKRSRVSRKCCTGNNYFSTQADECTPCPDGTPNLNGYYCEKNEEALMTE